MLEADIYAVLTGVFRTIFEQEDLTLRPEMYSADVARWDSFRNFDLMMAIEDAFNIQFEVEEVSGMMNVGDIVKTIQIHTAGRA